MANRLRISVLVLVCISWAGRSASAQPETPTTAVRVSFTAETPSSLPIRGALLFHSPEEKSEPLKVALTSARDLSLQLPSNSKWEVSAEIPGYWVARKELGVGPSDRASSLVLNLWPLGSVAGAVRLRERGGPLPKRLLVKTLAVPSFLHKPATPMGALDCPVDGKGAWSCSLPAAKYDLVISASGSAPVYRWGAQVEPGKTRDLGTVELVHGASLAGWVVVEGAKSEAPQSSARLSFVAAGGGSLQAASELRRAALEQQVDKDGFFQFTGIAPGTYSVEARRPGYPSVHSAPLRVDPGAETLLAEPLRLQPALALLLEVNPPLDWLDHRWRIQVFRMGESTPQPLVFDGRSDDAGQIDVSGQPEGRFRVSVLDSLGNSLYSKEHRLDETSGRQRIDVRFITVQGKIRLGKDPLAATLWFGGHSGATSVRMEADEEGRFRGVLPKEGFWRIEVQAPAPGFPTWTGADVHANLSGQAKVDVSLPNTRVFGRVVDQDGRPVPRADVTVQTDRLSSLTVADSEGAFEARGLPEGPAWLAAESPSGMSNRVPAALADDQAVGPVELRLRRMKRLTGVVTSPQRSPLAGTRLLILARSPDGGGAAATSGADGTFHVDLPQTASRIVAVVSPPGYALQAFDLPADDRDLLLSASEEKGLLEIDLPLTGEEMLRGNLFLAVFQNSLPLPSSALAHWAADHGQAPDAEATSLIVPDTAPGEYRVCLLPRQFEPILPWVTVSPGESTCASGALAPGATLVLKPEALAGQD